MNINTLDYQKIGMSPDSMTNLINEVIAQSTETSHAVDESLLDIKQKIFTKMSKLSIRLSFDEILAYEPFLKQKITDEQKSAALEFVNFHKTDNYRDKWVAYLNKHYTEFFQLKTNPEEAEMLQSQKVFAATNILQKAWHKFLDNRFKNFCALTERELEQKHKEVTKILLEKVVQEKGKDAKIQIDKKVLSPTFCLKRIEQSKTFKEIPEGEETLKLLRADAKTSKLWENIPSVKKIRPRLSLLQGRGAITLSTIKLSFLEEQQRASMRP